MDESTSEVLNKALGTLTRARHIAVFVGDSTASEEHIGHVMWANESHVIVNCEDGLKVFYLRTAVTKLEEKPLGTE